MNSYPLFEKEILPKLISFNNFYDLTGNYTNKQKGDFFEIITKYIFLFHPFYKNITKHIWLYNEIPYDLFKKLNIPQKDKGIDLVLLTNEYKYYAIQSKFRNNKKTLINWKDLSTFVGLTFGVSEKFQGAFYVTNTIIINEELLKCKRVIPIFDDFFDSLDNNFFEQIKCHFDNNKINNQYQLHIKRNYQIEFLQKSNDYYKTNDKGYINFAPGSGKTLMSYWFYQQLNPKYTIIGVPSLYLLSQFYKEWSYESYFENNMEFILIGSDVDIDNEPFINNGLLITTDQFEIYEKIVIFQNDNKNKNKNLIIITTYQSCDKLYFAIDFTKIKFNLGIIDEAHKTCQQLGHQFSILISDSKIKIEKRLFMQQLLEFIKMLEMIMKI